VLGALYFDQRITLNERQSTKFKVQRTMSEDYNPFPEPVVIEITDVFDLHTIPPKQVKAVVEEYLLEAHAKGFSVVRIIHGKGIGVQREIVRGVLERTDFVLDWTDAPPDAGGLGATMVRLKQSADYPG
jgi:DNA-nicking Smr family endonuclease